MATITPIINVHVYIEILANSIDRNWFGDDQAIFQDSNASW